MKRMMVAGVAMTILLTACGGGNNAFVAACVKQGEDQKTCECASAEMQKNLDPQMYKAITLAAEGKDEESQKIMQSLPMDKAMGGAMAMMGVAQKCNLKGGPGL